MTILNHTGSGPLVNKIISKFESEKAVDGCLRKLEGMFQISYEKETENFAARKRWDLESLQAYEEDFRRKYNAWKETIQHEHALVERMILQNKRK